MNKAVVIHQPDFLPYLGFFHRLLHVDLWVVLDNVQFIHKSSKGWHNRDKIKTPRGEKWITVAVQRCPVSTPFNEVLLSANVNWKEDHLNLIKQNYQKATYFNEIFPYIQDLYLFECSRLVDFNIKSINTLLGLFNIESPYIFASTLNPVGRKNELLVDILKKAGASSYLSGLGAKNYFQQRPFDQADIKVIWQDFKHPVYPQLHGGFISYLSSIDLLFNCGITESRKIIRRY